MVLLYPIGALRERDIDLLILEEVSCSIEFLKWLLNVVGIQVMPQNIIQTAVSRMQSSGESDIEIWFEDSQKQIKILLLENKIDANLQPNQAKRYTDRGATYKGQEHCSHFHTILIAPEIYLNRSSENLGFGYQISYQQLIEWFSNHQYSLVESRRNFKVTLLKRAIEKAELGYCLIEDAAVTDFWKQYWRKTLELTRTEG